MPELTHAGGVVTSLCDGETRVLLVRASKAPHEWVLPKGHIEAGETAEDAARREVLEEAGVDAEIIRPAGDLRYEANGETVRVRYFSMRFLQEGKATERREARWCTLAEADHLLVFANARDIVRRATTDAGNRDTAVPDTRNVSLKKRPWLSFLVSTRHERAVRHCFSLSLELDALTPTANPEVVEAARRFVDQAQSFLADDNVDGAWHCLNNAARRLVDLKDPAERLNQAKTLLVEAEKVSKWRRKAIEQLLCDEEGKVQVQTAASNLKDALALRDEYYENRYERLAMQREQLKNLVAIAVISLVGIVVMLALTRLDSLQPWDWRLLLLIVLFALTGASFSAFRSLASATEARIPDLALSNWMTLGRTMLGACLGIAVYALLTSKIIDVGPIDAPKVLAVAFAAGFSERLVVSAVEAVAGQGK